MTALDAQVYGRIGAVSMSPGSSDKRFRRQLKERDVVAGLTDGERRMLHRLAHKYRRQIGRPYGEIKPEPIWSGDRPTEPLLHEET
ncbi:hypothetical protein [Bradyrhizobium sp. WSM1253]|uniref:hypothetical protein n=1 Tax=Bradyrhizobium sp. WSM1253 TaxID=319003 RepID=UPI00025D3044|nr:hypothetical protein [Bradyrhizobium sp. WSM1253]EIG62808.1 hypothetical protein Bra1253DRAFT_07744 [Bradyrhizobium sp. WSM1253]